MTVRGFIAIKNKRGSEVVEAAIVMPLIILIIAGLVCAAVFCYRALENQVEDQREALKEIGASSSVFNIKKIERITSSRAEDMVPISLSRTYKSEVTVINEAAIIRAGEFIYDEG